MTKITKIICQDCAGKTGGTVNTRKTVAGAETLCPVCGLKKTCYFEEDYVVVSKETGRVTEWKR
jgi:hypothetical protein